MTTQQLSAANQFAAATRWNAYRQNYHQSMAHMSRVHMLWLTLEDPSGGALEPLALYN